MDGAVKELVQEVVSGEVFGVWFLIGAALVFWMQAGFAMVEAGFTRAKNTGNIIMKNLMDFCIGTVVFILIGFGLLMGEDLFGFIGRPGFDLFTDYAEFDFSSFVFNLVFCATTATIVSGAMAERTKFLSYCIYSGVISALIYPIEAHWIWGGGWLAQIGFHDFAGSCAIHMVGGISALIGAKILGSRIGKFTRDESGKIVKVNVFPGHSIALGALGVFILWLGWYGFNGAAATSIAQLGSIFLTTTVAQAAATVASQRNVKIVAQPRGKGYVPSPPEVSDTVTLVRSAEIGRNFKSYPQSYTNGNVAITGKIAIKFQGISVDTEKVFQTGVERRIVKYAVDKILSDIIRNNSFLE